MNNKRQRNMLFTMLLLVMALLIPQWGWAQETSQPSVGDGTANNPYIITKAEELAWFRDYVNGVIVDEEAFNKEEIRHHVQLCDTATHKIFYDKLEFIYVEIAKFDKSLEELETLYDKWLYALKNLYKLTQRPKTLCDKVFDRLFEEAEIARFTPQEQREYEASKMAYRDIKNSIDTAKREGKEEGLAEGMEKGLAEGMEKGLAEGMEKGLAEGMEKGLAKGMEKGMNQRNLEIARKMLANGMDAATVMEITGLSESQLQQLKG